MEQKAQCCIDTNMGWLAQAEGGDPQSNCNPADTITFSVFSHQKKKYVEEIDSHWISPNQQTLRALSSTLGTTSNPTILVTGGNVLWQYLLLAEKTLISICHVVLRKP